MLMLNVEAVAQLILLWIRWYRKVEHEMELYQLLHISERME